MEPIHPYGTALDVPAFPHPRSQPSPQERSDFYEQLWRREEEGVRPACWFWESPPPPELIEVPGSLWPVLAPFALHSRFLAFHAQRCSICGERRRLLEDHDHATGLTRGLLCASCNGLEGARSGTCHDRWARYRFMNPASILGISRKYPWLRGRR
ncbi:endonuclease domain-containing protein [Streptomyces sp. NPDC127123]